MAEKNGTSIWKKELSFGRKSTPKPASATPNDPVAREAEKPKSEKTSVWKKELSLGRKSKPKTKAPAPAVVASAPEPKSDKPSVWKKELSLGRKSKPKSKPVALPAAEPVASAAKPTPEKTSVWKKELSFGRKSKPKSKTVALPAAEPVVSAAKPTPEKTSVWKKELSLGRKSKPKAAPAAAAVVAAAPKAEKTSMWKKELSFGRKSKPKPAAEAAAPVGAVSPPQPEPAAAAGPAPVVSPVAPESAPEPAVPASAAPQMSAPAPPPVTPGAVPPPPPAVPVTPLPVSVPPAVEPDVAVPPPAAAVAPAGAPEPPADPPAAATSGPGTQVRTSDEQAAAGKHNQLVGLKLGASQIAAAQVVNKGGPKVVRMAREPLQRGIVVGGELREPEELASVLKAFFKKHKLPKNCVRLGISNNRIGVRTFEITGVSDPKQLANAVRFRAQETLPIPLEEAVLDYRILDDRIGEDGERVCRVLLVVAHKGLVDRYVAACRKAGLKLVGIDLEAFALLRALSDPAHVPGEDAAVVCVSIGHDRSTLAVSDGRVCEFTRVLAWGGSALDAALARVLDQTPLAVVPIKHALSMTGEGEAAGLDARQADEARRAMAAELQSFARELVASLRFYQEQPKSLGIVEILITGGAAALDGLAAELERLIGIPVRVADPLMRVQAPRAGHAPDDHSSASMAIAVGLGIDD